MTPYQAHRAKWGACKKCHLSKTRYKVVIGRGKVPSPLLMIGEAPGISEDIAGSPFVGASGRLLDQIIERGLDGQVDYCLTNLVGCLPRNEDGIRCEPSKESIEACTPRLQEIIALCNPRVVVCIGRLATKWCTKAKRPELLFPGNKPEVVSMIHPAAILRMGVVHQGLAVQRSIIILEDILEVCV